MSIERNTVGGWQKKMLEHIYMHDTQIRHNFISNVYLSSADTQLNIYILHNYMHIITPFIHTTFTLYIQYSCTFIDMFVSFDFWMLYNVNYWFKMHTLQKNCDKLSTKKNTNDNFNFQHILYIFFVFRLYWITFKFFFCVHSNPQRLYREREMMCFISSEKVKN